jgi:apolipoprotein N-acyltransferase
MATFRQHLFDSETNPAIGFLREKMLWATQTMPDLSTSNAVRAFGFFYALFLIGWLLMEGISILGIIARVLLMALFFGVVYAKLIACLIWVVLFKWEKFK